MFANGHIYMHDKCCVIDRHEANNLSSVSVPWERTEKDGEGERRREEERGKRYNFLTS
jgi:hypothetical protein